MAIGSITSVRWKQSKLRSFSASVIKAVVSAAYEISHHQQADGDSLFEIRQVIAGLREYQSDAEESDRDSSDDDDALLGMAPRCPKHPDAGALVGVCPFCLTACLTKLAQAEDAASSDCASDLSSSPATSGRSMSLSRGQGAENRSQQGILDAVKVTPSSSKPPLKASAPLAALKEGIPRSAAASAASGKASQIHGPCLRKLEARDSTGNDTTSTASGGATDSSGDKTAPKADAGRRMSTAQVVHQYCSVTSGYLGKNGKAGVAAAAGTADGGSQETRPARRSTSDRNPSLLSIMLRDRRKGGGKDSSAQDKLGGARADQIGDGKCRQDTAPLSQHHHTVSWVPRIRSRRPADVQNVAKKLTVSALVHPDGVAV